MQAYERSMQKGDTHMVLRPDSDFFRYFGDPSGKSSTLPRPAVAPK
jgi:membrane protease subunit HflC